LWDIRSPKTWECQYLAHNGPALCVDWHREHRHWLASGGRDKLVHVWDMSHSSKLITLYTVQTIAGVAKLRWRPTCRYQIVTTALLTDYGLNEWDLRRPFAPIGSYPLHRDIVTGTTFVFILSNLTVLANTE